jgi:hypothetical protein
MSIGKAVVFAFLVCASATGASSVDTAPVDTVCFAARLMGGIFTQEIAESRIDPRRGLSLERPVFYSFFIPRVGVYVGFGGVLAGKNTEVYGYYDDSLITDLNESITTDTLLATEYVIDRLHYKRGLSAGVMAGIDFQLRVLRFGGGLNAFIRSYTDITEESVRRDIIDHSIEDDSRSHYGTAANIDYLLYGKVGVTMKRLSLMVYLEYGQFKQTSGIVFSWRIGSFGQRRAVTRIVR